MGGMEVGDIFLFGFGYDFCDWIVNVVNILYENFYSCIMLSADNTNSLSSNSHLRVQQQKSKQSVTSLRKQCLNSLRFPSPGSSQQAKPKTHLLACMSQFVDEQPEIKVEEVDDYCCFDRMKKIIQRRKHCHKFDHPNNVDHDDGMTQNQRLSKFVQIQAKMKKMEQNLMKYSTAPIKNEPNDTIAKKPTLYDSSLPNLFLTAPVQQKWSDAIITENCSKKQKNQSLPGRHEMKKKLREQGYKQYLEWQKKKIIDSQNDIREFVETQIQEKVKNMLEERDIKYNQLLKNQKDLERSILEKNLEIQNLKAKQCTLMKNLQELQAFKDLFSEQNTVKSKETLTFFQNFYKQFGQAFPNETVSSLKSYVQTLIEKCLHKFNDIECKKFDKWNEQKSDMNEKIHKLENTIYKFKATQNELLNNLKEFRHEQNEATMEMDCLLKKEAELQRLQRKILQLYNNWYEKVPESSKGVMKSIGYLQGNYEYETMLEHIVVFQTKFSTESKVNDYLIKILRGVERIRKILFPRTVSNLKERNQIMDPLYILDKLEKYMKSKVYQIQKKSNCIPKGTRTSHIIEQQFLGVQQVQNLLTEEAKPEKNPNEGVIKHASFKLNPKIIQSTRLKTPNSRSRPGTSILKRQNFR